MTTTENRATAPTRTGRRRIGFLALLFAALMSVFLGLASPAGATTHLSGNHYGGTLCDSWGRYVDNAGAEACVNRGSYAAGSYFDLQNIAYDYAKDGLSARSVVTVQQFIGGKWIDTKTLTTATSSNGLGWNYVAPVQRLSHKAGATHFRLVVTACTWDKPTNSYYSCATRALTSTSWY